jgi:hypothetical protein
VGTGPTTNEQLVIFWSNAVQEGLVAAPLGVLEIVSDVSALSKPLPVIVTVAPTGPLVSTRAMLGVVTVNVDKAVAWSLGPPFPVTVIV